MLEASCFCDSVHGTPMIAVARDVYSRCGGSVLKSGRCLGGVVIPGISKFIMAIIRLLAKVHL